MGVPRFVGRNDALAQLERARLDQPSTMVIAIVSGTAGIGKTTLALNWAHRMRREFPDGQLYVNLRGFGPVPSVMDPEEAIRGFLDALGMPPHRIPPSVEAQAGLYRSLVAVYDGLPIDEMPTPETRALLADQRRAVRRRLRMRP